MTMMTTFKNTGSCFVMVPSYDKEQNVNAGEKFGTDQYDDTITSDLALNTRVSWKNGLVTKATIASPYVFKGFHNDNEHSLAQIEVSDTAVSNA